MKTIFTIYARHLLDSYNLGDPVVLNYPGANIYGWVISDALYALLLLTHPQNSRVYHDSTQESLYLKADGSFRYGPLDYHNKVIELWSKR